ncbi:MAG: hypothetical protein U0326_06455 [Polyangiales bacterium]
MREREHDVFTQEHGRIGLDRRAPEHVPELAHVAGPAVVAQEGERGRVQRTRTDFGGKLGEQVMREAWQIRDTIPKGREVHDEGVEAVEEVRAEAVPVDQLIERAVGRDDESHVHADGSFGANGSDLAALKDAQQRGLRVGRELSDLVEEEGARVGLFEETPVTGVCARERAPLVAEELREERALGERGDVRHDERSTLARRERVQRASDELLARPRLPQDDDRRGRTREAGDSRAQYAHRGGATDEPRRRFEIAGRRERRRVRGIDGNG